MPWHRGGVAHVALSLGFDFRKVVVVVDVVVVSVGVILILIIDSVTVGVILILIMDSTTDKERNDHPKWPKDKGPAYLASFVFELATFMMRIGLAVFAHLTIEDMPESFPAGGPRAAEATEGTTTRVRSRQSMADFVAEYPDIDSEIKYKRAR